MVDFYTKLVGKYTLRPMNSSWDMLKIHTIQLSFSEAVGIVGIHPPSAGRNPGTERFPPPFLSLVVLQVWVVHQCRKLEIPGAFAEENMEMRAIFSC